MRFHRAWVAPYPTRPVSEPVPTDHAQNRAALKSALLGCLAVCLSLPAANAQDSDGPPLYLIDAQTSTASVSFRFPDSRSFGDERLRAQMAINTPTFWDRVFFWRNRTYPFDPIELQKDVVRLRRFYNRNGFLYPQIAYTSSRLDTTRNKIDVVIEIEEGPPLIIQDVGYYASDGRYAVTQFPESQRDEWEEFSTEIALRIGDRYSEFQRISIQSKVLNWLLDNGYAFAQVDGFAEVDSTYNVADVRFEVDAGPPTYVDTVAVQGNEQVSANVVRREVPLLPGDRYSRTQLVRGQEEIFGLNLFRVVLADVPEQDRDSSVTVRYRVRESKFKIVSGQAGYSLSQGAGFEAGWQNRNLFGGARNISIGLISDTGLGARASGNNQTPWKLQAKVSLSQPYFLSRRTSAIVVPYILFERDPRLRESDRFYGMNRREIGLESTVVYQFARLRTLTGKYVFNRTLDITQPIENDPSFVRDPYTKSVFSFTGNFGRTDDLLRPTRGFEVHPFLEVSSAAIGSEIQYVKAGSDVVGYLPLSDKLNLTARIFAARAEPLGDSKRALDGLSGQLDSLKFENRFDNVLLEAGGASDVRGWAEGFLGAKIPRPSLNRDGSVSGYVYEPVGGRAKWTASVTLQYPFPWLGSQWRLASFVDAGQVSAGETPTGFVDNGGFDLDRWRVGVGSGIRYATPFGFVRLDLGYKLNPSRNDLRTPEEAFLGIDNSRDLRRFRLHLSLSQTF